MVFEKVSEIIKRELNVKEEITLETHLRDDLGADSMDAVQIVVQFEEEFNIEIPDEVLITFKTVSDIVTYIESQI